jgi:hypothetical protein
MLVGVLGLVFGSGGVDISYSAADDGSVLEDVDVGHEAFHAFEKLFDVLLCAGAGFETLLRLDIRETPAR